MPRNAPSWKRPAASRWRTCAWLRETGVDRISIGALTKDVKAVDLSMRIHSLEMHLSFPHAREFSSGRSKFCDTLHILEFPNLSEIVMSNSKHIVCPHCDAVNRVPSEKLARKPHLRQVQAGTIYLPSGRIE